MTEFKLREAVLNDALEILRWRNDSDSVKFSRKGLILNRTEHFNWFSKILESNTDFLYVGEIDNVLIGMVRFSKIDKESIYEISINVAPEFRGIGIGTKIIYLSELELLKEIGKVTVSATVFTNNKKSISIFIKNDYVIFCEMEKTLEFRKNLI